MAESWFPEIDYNKCIGCGKCSRKCANGVYENKNDKPIVIFKKGCIQGCHGCGNICPVGAIKYYGDSTDWIAPALIK